MTKSTYRIFFLTIALSVVAAGVLTTRGSAWQQQPGAQLERDHYSRVMAAIKRAKAAGLTEITLSTPVVMPTGVASVNDLIRDYSLLRVIVRDAATLVGDHDVLTWYKLGVLEVLNRQARVEEGTLQGAPLQLLPLTRSEVFYISRGGTAVADGITITEPPVEAGLVLQKDQQYVGGFFLSAGGQLATTAALSASLYELNSNDDLKPRGSLEHPLVRDFRDYLGNRLSVLRNTISRQVGVPKTSLK